MKRTKHQMTDGYGRYCAMGAYLHILGATDKQLFRMQQDIRYLREFLAEKGESQRIADKASFIMLYNDMGLDRDLNSLLKELGMPLLLSEDEDWILKDTSTDDRLFELVCS